MSEKVLIIKNNQATFICPTCGNSATKDVTRFMESRIFAHIRCDCPCGYSNDFVVDRSLFVSKKLNVHLISSFMFQTDN